MAEAGVLNELEALFNQFFSASSTNEQKLEINRVLESFAQQQGVWRYCVYFVRHSRNEHVLMFSLNLLENLVTHVWVSLDAAEKAELRHFLMDHLISYHTSLPPFISNKLIKVLVYVGRADWPHQYPEFFSHLLQLIHVPETAPLGLTFLLTASEELGSPRGDLITTSRREELSRLMHQQVPTVLSILVHTLETVAEKQRHSVTPTPPPSPNASPLKQPLASRGSPLNNPTHPRTPLALASHSKSHLSPPTHHRHAPIVAGNAPYAPLDSKTEEVCILALRCLAHLFSWMPLSSVITPSILDTIFHFASLGCDSAADATDNSGNLGSLAMDCVNELLVKNCVPREFEAFLMKLFEKSFVLLQRLTGESERGISCNFSQLDDRFLAKCSDFFYWFVSSHLKRVEFNPNFPVLEFLELFFKYTFKQPEVDSFCVCLDTWGVFLDHLIMMTSSDAYGGQSPPTNNHYERYKDILVSMVNSVLKKVQLHYNIDELREIDDDAIDDDNETEWQSFLRQSLEFVGRVAELFPSETFQLLLPLLESYSQVYLSLGQIVMGEGPARSLMLTEGPECEKLHAVLKDLTSILQALGRLAEHFIGDYFMPRLSEAQLLVEKFCILAKYGTDSMLFNVSNPVPEILDHDFIEMQAQALGTLQAFTHWLAQLYLDSIRQEQNQDTVAAFISTVVESATPLIAQDIPEKVVLAACQLLLSLSVTVRPRILSSLPGVGGLMGRAATGQLNHLPHRAQMMVHRALCSMLVLPWPETPDSDQQWATRSNDLTRLVAGTTRVFHQLQQSPGWSQNSQLLQQVKPEVRQSLTLLEDLAASLAHEHSKSKATLFQALSPSVDFSISLFPLYLDQPDVLDSLMSFFLTLFDGLKSQVGSGLTERTTQTFMTLLTRQRLEEALLQEGSLGSRVVGKFLKILQLLVQDPGVPSETFLPSIISFVLKQIYPIVCQKPAPDIKTVLYELLFQLLLNNWRYFFPATVLAHMDSDDPDPLEHQAEFFNIMESFGHSFLQPDIAIFKLNLNTLETLNSKHKLYSKLQFRGSILYPFLQLLLQVLIHKSHDLLQEEICLSVYSMAAVDFPTYHHQFLPKFLTGMEGLTSEQQTELSKNYKLVEDLPSFVQNVRQFANDLRYFLTLNRSLPVGSVKLS